MEWTPGGQNDDIEDRRDDSGGGGGGFGFGGIHLGCGGIILVGILSLIFHTNLFTLFSGSGQQAVPVNRPASNAPRNLAKDTEYQFMSAVLIKVQAAWTTILPEQTQHDYRHAKLVLFRDAYPSGCGEAQSAIGPFYCPEDEKVYLDLGFFDELKTRFGAPGEFAQAYVVAHEFGHHVQKILGIEGKVQQLREENPRQANPLSVRLELQADCFAGVWGHTAMQQKMINDADVEQGLAAAAAVGDDRLQRAATGQVSPEKFTHGSSAQRVQWFRNGLSTGQVSACNTFQKRQQN